MIYFDVKYEGTWYRIESEHCVPEDNRSVPEDIFYIAKDCGSDETCMIQHRAKEDPAPYIERDLRKVFEDVRFVSSDWYPNKPQVVY